MSWTETDHAAGHELAKAGRKITEHAALLASHAALAEALETLMDAEWMVTHDWGGDREAPMKAARAALATYHKLMEADDADRSG